MENVFSAGSKSSDDFYGKRQSVRYSSASIPIIHCDIAQTKGRETRGEKDQQISQS